MEEQGRPDKPLSVRELESGESSPPSAREEGAAAVGQSRGEEGSAAPQGPVEEADAVDQETEDEVRRPTPVRMVMEGAEAETSDVPMDRRTIPDPDGGEEWVVTVGGWSVSGILPLRTVSLLELYFARVGEPQVPVRRTLCPGENLEDFSDGQIEQAFHASEPYSPSLREEREGNGRSRGRRGHPKSRD